MRSGRAVACAGAALIFAGCCLAPLACLLIAPALAGRSDAYRSVLLDARQLQLIGNSARIAAGATLLATAVGAPLGLLLARVPLAAWNVVRLVLVMPIVLPTYALALSWIYLTGAAGLVTRAIGSDALARLTYSPFGAAIVLGLALYPISMLATEAAARRVESRLEEAALLVAPPLRALAHVTFPLLWPSVASSMLLTFVLTLSDYSVPNLLRQRVYTTEVFTAFAAFYDAARATALALPLVGVAWLAGSIVASQGMRVIAAHRTSSIVGISFPRLVPAAVVVAASVISTAVVLPFGVLAAEAGRVTVVTDGLARSGTAIGESLGIASLAATIASGVALVLGHRRARSDRPLMRWVDAALVAIFAAPGTIVGVALIQLWNRAGWSALVYGSPVIVAIAYLARFLPVAILVVSAAVRRVPRSSEEAAAMSGAGWGRTMFRIVAPQIAPSLLVAWVLVFVLAFGEVGASVLVAPAGHAPYPVHVFTLIANAPTEQVAALALLQAAVTAIPFAMAVAYAMKSRRRD